MSERFTHFSAGRTNSPTEAIRPSDIQESSAESTRNVGDIQLSTTGEPTLLLFASSENVEPLLAQIQANFDKRNEKGTTPVVVDDPVVTSKGRTFLGIGKRRFAVSYDGHEYEFAGRGTIEAFTTWITEYCKKAPKCITCEQVIFPGEPVGNFNIGVMHMNCCPSGGFFVGHLDKEGNIVSHFE